MRSFNEDPHYLWKEGVEKPRPDDEQTRPEYPPVGVTDTPQKQEIHQEWIYHFHRHGRFRDCWGGDVSGDASGEVSGDVSGDGIGRFLLRRNHVLPFKSQRREMAIAMITLLSYVCVLYMSFICPLCDIRDKRDFSLRSEEQRTKNSSNQNSEVLNKSKHCWHGKGHGKGYGNRIWELGNRINQLRIGATTNDVKREYMSLKERLSLR